MPDRILHEDTFARIRALFDLPRGSVYLDGNSLGPLPRAVRERLSRVVDEEWGRMLIRGWNEAGWMDLPSRLGTRIGALIGAPEGTVMVADSTSVNLFKVLSAALALRPERKVILSDSGNFPTDLYVAQRLAAYLGRGHELRLVAPEEVADAINREVAVLMLTEVDYRTARRHGMTRLTARAHEAGALTVWDLAHSAGAMPVDLAGAGADFAVGCTYKYLNGGPGAPAYVYVREDFANRVEPAAGGWMGHEAPFAFDPEYRPAKGIERLRVGTPGILGMSALDAALEVWKGVDMKDVREQSVVLSELFISETERRCARYGVRPASPRDPELRGSHVSLRFAEGYAVMQALIASNVIGDFRAPDLMRFGFSPLYNTKDDVLAAAERLERILRRRLWDKPEFKQRAKVT